MSKGERRRREKEPLDIRLTMRVKFGEDPDDVVTVVDNRRLKLAGSAFQYRDRAIRFLVYNVLRAGAQRPKIYGRFGPTLSRMTRAFAGGARRVAGI
jgi:hypothetical protein